MSTTGYSQWFRPPTASGSGNPSGRIYADTTLTQLAGAGYVFAGTATSQYWDDAGYWGAYGSRAAGQFASTAIVAFASSGAGRYRFHFLGVGQFIAPAIAISRAHVFVIMEQDDGGTAQVFYENPIAPTSTSDESSVHVAWEGWLDATGCVGVNTILCSSPSHDQIQTGSYCFIEFLGS